MDQRVDQFILKNEQHQDALILLRDILNGTELQETIKWGAPTYTVDGKNVVGLGAFKAYVGLWFFNGVFLKDQEKVLVNAQEGTTKALRQWRFSNSGEINPELVLKYVEEAIQNQKDGKELKPEKKKLVIPVELSDALEERKELADAFKALSPGKQREYADHIASAKQQKTKVSRLEKAIPMILDGKGLHDKYKNC